MKVKNLYPFLFHPFDKSQNQKRQKQAVFFFVLASLLTLGSYLVIVGGVRLAERIFKKEKKGGKTKKVFDKTIKIPTDKKVKTPSGKTNKKESPLVQPSKKENLNEILAKRRNLDISSPGQFLGTAHFKKMHATQLALFRIHAQTGNWNAIHSDHFDWWMFPLHWDTQSKGKAYQILEKDRDLLKEDKDFMDLYREGVHLAILAYGYDLSQGVAVQNPGKGQAWTGYEIRLSKIALSLKYMGEEALFAKVQVMAKDFIGKAKIHNSQTLKSLAI